MEETKVIYHIDDQETPYLIKLPKSSDRVTLLDLKNALNRFNCKYFFKSMDDDFGVVKEEIVDDRAFVPNFNGRIVTWLVTSDSSISDTQSQCAESVSGGQQREKLSHQNEASASSRNLLRGALSPATVKKRRLKETVENSAKPPAAKQEKSSNLSRDISQDSRRGSSRRVAPNGCTRPSRHNHGFDGGSSVMSSDIETTSFVDSDDGTSTRISTTTETTHRSRHAQRKKKKSRHRLRVISQASSFSSITDSTMSLNIITVQLSMENANFLGISIVGQSSKGGDGGIYVGSIMKGGAVALDGRIEPGDMILEVNGISFENMTNDDAVRALREAVQHPGPITLVVAKCWDPNPKGYFTVPRQEPVRPMDPSTWVTSQTDAMRGMWGRGGAPSVSTMTSASSSIVSSVPPHEYIRRPTHSSNTSSSSHSSKSFNDLNLTKNADMATIVRAMAQPDSGLEVRDRMWLKIRIPHSFIGSELVDWLYSHVQGFADRRDARRYACNLLKFGYIQHTVNKLSFSEQCYYIFGTNICTDNLAAMSLDDIDSVSSIDTHDRDVLRPLPTPPPLWNPPPYISRPAASNFLPQPLSTPSYASNPYAYMNETASYVSMPGVNGAESCISESVKRDKTCACIVSHTYKQIKKLWDNPDKTTAGQNAIRMIGKFDPDIDLSTSSDTGSSDSEGSQSRDKNKDAQRSASTAAADTGAGSSRQPAERGLPAPPPRDLGAGELSAEMCASRQSFRLAMGNAYTDDTLHVMGDL